MRAPPLRRERGITLIVSLIMLVLITLLAVTSYQLGTGSLQIVGDMQQRNHTLAAAQTGVEYVLSNPNFTMTPADALPNPCNGNPNTACIDVNDDGTPDVTVTVGSQDSSGHMQPAPCLQQVKPVANATLDLNKEDDVGCATGSAQSFGVAGSNSGNSMCTDMQWQIDAVAKDASLGATSTVSVGVSYRSASDDANPTYSCR